MIKELTIKEFEEIKNNGVVIVDFYTEWCGDCKIMEPIYQNLHDKYEDKVTFVKVNAEDAGVFRIKGPYNVLRVPTFIIYKDGKEIARGIEYNPMQVMEDWIKKAIK